MQNSDQALGQALLCVQEDQSSEQEASKVGFLFNFSQQQPHNAVMIVQDWIDENFLKSNNFRISSIICRKTHRNEFGSVLLHTGLSVHNQVHHRLQPGGVQTLKLRSALEHFGEREGSLFPNGQSHITAFVRKLIHTGINNGRISQEQEQRLRLGFYEYSALKKFSIQPVVLIWLTSSCSLAPPRSDRAEN